jgi:hypothetical protein
MDSKDIVAYIFIAFIVIVCILIYYKDELQLKCVISTVDGNKYCVRDRKEVQRAADLLAKVTKKCGEMVKYLNEKYPDKENVKRLVNGFNPKKIIETLPTSEYTAYSENKGEKIAFCLNLEKKENHRLIDEHTLTFVALHELSHIATKSVGHKSEFWENFKFILENAKEAGIHEPANYKESPQKYCGMTIRDNPFYDA